MIEAFLSWCIIGCSAYLWGYIGLTALGKIGSSTDSTKGIMSFDCIFLLGLCFLTVYAQFFSLFYKVGFLALLFVLLVDLFIIIRMKRLFVQKIKQMIALKSVTVLCLIVISLVGFFILVLTTRDVEYYDTYLYHAQSIRWIEEYGIAEGLGNLHNRFAYNSAFFCLQALFSFSFLLGRSLHTLNGLIVCFFLCYAICSMKAWKQKKFFASDIVRAGIIVYYSLEMIYCAPSTDILAMGIVLYIFTKWISYWEDNESRIPSYIFLCIMSLWGISIKLSSAMLILVALYPLILLVRNKSWKQIVYYLVLGLIVIAPFLIRNVVISGYLIYPYPELDLFQVDWKMSAERAINDRHEIAAWGRGFDDVLDYTKPVGVWLPLWYEKLSNFLKVMLWSTLVAFVVGLIRIVCKICRGIKADKASLMSSCQYLLILGVMAVSLTFWLIGAPLPRYGAAYLLIIPLFVFGELLMKINKKNMETVMVAPICMAFCMGVLISPFLKIRLTDVPERLTPDYRTFECVENDLDGVIIYTPITGDQAGYYAFPSTPYKDTLERIELRGDNVKYGFREKIVK